MDNIRKPTVITPTTGILTRANIKALIKSFPIIATTEDTMYNIHLFAKEGDTESVLLSCATDRGTTYHKIKIHHHKYQTDTFIINDTRYNIDKLQEV